MTKFPRGRSTWRYSARRAKARIWSIRELETWLVTIETPVARPGLPATNFTYIPGYVSARRNLWATHDINNNTRQRPDA